MPLPRLAPLTGALAAAILLLAAPAAPARDYAGTALDIIPSGQYGDLPVPAGADEQARLYDGLTPLFDQVTPADLERYFKSERLGSAGSPAPTATEKVPRRGVRIVRDHFHVPHITGRTRDDVTWATGWVAAEDRGLLLEEGRWPARLAALDAPNVDAFGLIVGLKSFTPTRQADRIIARQTSVLRAAGPKGRSLLHDIDVYVQGINAYLRATKSRSKPWTRVDVYAVNALVGQIFGQGGGDEARRSELLDALSQRLGTTSAHAVFDDLSEHQDAESPDTTSRSFPYGHVPASAPGSVVLDSGSLQPVYPGGAGAARVPSSQHRWASNFLMVGRGRSTNGHPLFVAGPQIGYFYPGLTFEIDLRGPGFQARGASAPGFPGNVLIGRGEDFGWSLTSAGSDNIDTFVETLCGGSDLRYRYKGRCLHMGVVDAGTIAGTGTVRYHTTVHGPVTGYATVGGRRVALSRKRSSFGRDVLFQLLFRDLTLDRVTSARSFFRAASQSPFTFNSAYVDDRDIASYSGGLLPVRAPGVDPRLPTNGDGRYEWRGFLRARDHPQVIAPANGTLVNWNNRPAKDFGAADDNWAYGPIQRVQLLQAGLDARPAHDLASVVGAMNKAATQDARNQLVLPDIAAVLGATKAPSPRDQRMLDDLVAWRAAGSSRLDRDGDGLVDDPGAAIMDAAWGRIGDAVLGPVLGPQLPQLAALGGRDVGPASGFTGSWMGYVDKDLRTVLGRPVASPYRMRYCGNGDLTACSTSLWSAIDAAGDELRDQQGGNNPDRWHADANAERIHFAPGLLTTTMRYTNRPSGIQQVLTFTGHRKRR